MGAEQHGEQYEPADPATLLELKGRLFTAWQQLPAEHRATTVLALVGEVIAGEQGAWLREAIALQWPPGPGSIMGKPGITAEDGSSAAGLDGSTFDAWMEQADRFVYDTVGCSIHDLPDCDFYNMWRDGLPPSEAADTALTEAGFDPFA